MRVDIERYNRNELYLLKDGTYIVIIDLEPFSGDVRKYSKRRVSFIRGNRHAKSSMFDNGFTIEIGDINTIIDLKLKSEETTTVGVLDGKVASYLGKLNQKIAERLGKSLSDMY